MPLTKSKPPKRPPARAKGGKKPGVPTTAQQTIPYRQMLPDGICRVNDQFYTKTIQYEDINYSVASTDDQSAIFDGYCAFLNYFDSALPFQLSFINHRSNPDSTYTVNIPSQNDQFNSVRGEYVEMLETQIAKSNNGIVRSKYITFGLAADSLTIARQRLERMEADIIGNYKKLGVQARPSPGQNGWMRCTASSTRAAMSRFRSNGVTLPRPGFLPRTISPPPALIFGRAAHLRLGRYGVRPPICKSPPRSCPTSC